MNTRLWMRSAFTTVLAAIVLIGIGACSPSGGGGGGGGDGGGNDNAANGNDNGVVTFDFCTSEGGEDDGIDFRDQGATRVVATSIGQGRHLVLVTNQTLVYELDQPVRFCAVIPENITLRNASDDRIVVLTEDQVRRENITDNDGEVIASRIIVNVPSEVAAGNDYELTLDSETLGLDGEYLENAGTNLAANTTLPSGDGQPGGDFVQRFRAVGAISFLSSTQNAVGLALDASDNVYIANASDVLGPFGEAKEVVDSDRLSQALSALAPRTIVIDNDGDIVVKAMSDGVIWEIDAQTRLASEIARADDLGSFPNDAVVAPATYASIERSAVEPGDILYANTASISVLDRRGGIGQKGGVNLLDRPSGNISDSYVSMFVPPLDGSAEQVIYGVYKPEDNTGMQIHRILPNGVVDASVLTNPSSMDSVQGTAVVKLDNIRGEQEYLIIGTVDTATANLKQILSNDFDGRALMVYNETRKRLQVLFTLSLDTFDFSSFGAFSDLVIDSTLNNAYVSLPSASAVLRFSGFANGGTSAGDPACDDSLDDAIAGQIATGTARVFQSTLGNGRHLLRSSPTVLEFDIDQPVPLCAVNSDNIQLVDTTSGQPVSLAGQRIKRLLISDASQNLALGSRIIIDLPSSLTTGNTYEITLNASALGLDGEFASSGVNGRLPSGDGSAGGDFAQVFQLIEGDYFVTETGGSVGVDLDGDDRLYTATSANIMGPFTTPGTPGPSNTIVLGDGNGITGQELTKAGKPMIASDDPADPAAAYASLQDARILTADPTTGIVQIFQTDFGQPGLGSFEVDMVQTPPTYGGDYIVLNTQRAVIFDVAAATSVTLFSSESQIVEFFSLYVPPTALFGETMYTTISDRNEGTLKIQEVMTDGQLVDRFTPLVGASGEASARLIDYLGDDEYLIVGQFDRTGAQISTRQIRDTTSGSELILYNPARSVVQVIGSVSLGGDMAFSQDLDTVYTSHPVLRAVLRLRGLAAR